MDKKFSKLCFMNRKGGRNTSSVIKVGGVIIIFNIIRVSWVDILKKLKLLNKYYTTQILF